MGNAKAKTATKSKGEVAAASIFDQIQSSNDRQFEDVFVPEWNVTVRIQEFGGRDRDEFEVEAYEMQKRYPNDRVSEMSNFRARQLSRSMVDPETGAKIAGTPERVIALGNKSGVVIDRLYEIHNRINKTTSDPEEEAKNS